MKSAREVHRREQLLAGLRGDLHLAGGDEVVRNGPAVPVGDPAHRVWEMPVEAREEAKPVLARQAVGRPFRAEPGNGKLRAFPPTASRVSKTVTSEAALAELVGRAHSRDPATEHYHPTGHLRIVPDRLPHRIFGPAAVRTLKDSRPGPEEKGMTRPLGSVAPMLRTVAVAAAFASLYFLTAKLTGWLSGDSALLWPASGVYLGVMLVAPRRLWPALACAAGVGSLLTYLHGGTSLELSVAFAVPSSAEGLLAAVLIERIAGTRFTLAGVRDLFALVVGGAVVANGLVAHFGGGGRGAVVRRLLCRELAAVVERGRTRHDRRRAHLHRPEPGAPRGGGRRSGRGARRHPCRVRRLRRPGLPGGASPRFARIGRGGRRA